MFAAAITTCIVHNAAHAQPAAPPEAEAATASQPSSPAIETNPAVRAALEIPRKTPAEHFQAILWLIDLDRPELAKPILDELTKLQLNDEQRAALVSEFGSRAMLQLAQSKELAPAGAQFADACTKAAAAAMNDPNRVNALVAQLVDPSAEVRLMARNDIAAIGQPGVTAVLEALARETKPARRLALAEAVAAMDPLVVGPLVAMLDTRDSELRITVADLLQQLSVRPAAPLLAKDRATAEKLLTRALYNYRQGMLPFAADASDQIELWNWDDANKKLSVAKYPTDEARIIWMARLAEELTRWHPQNPLYQDQATMLALEAASLHSSPHSPASAELESADVASLNRILARALSSNYAHAAVAAATALGQRGNADVLLTADAKPSPLAEALHHPNRRVRFAALRAIMTLDPNSPYPGSSRVPEALAWFAAGTGERRAIVAMSNGVTASNLAGMLADQKLDAVAVETGREAVDLALETPDLEMIFVDVNINAPDIRQVVYELRISPTTAEVPIAILAPISRLADAEQIASEHDRVVASPRIHSPEVLGRLVEQLTALSGRFAVTGAERAMESVESLAWLARLALGHRPFYKIRRSEPVIEAALYNPAAAEPAIAALSQLSDPQAQRALVNFASQPVLPIVSRSAAADAFRKNVALHGLLLTSSEILTQYDRYNASETADADTQRVLGSLLDTIEAAAHPAVELPIPPKQ